MDNDGDPGDEWRHNPTLSPPRMIAYTESPPVVLACDREVLAAALMEHSRALAVFIVGCLDWEKASPTREWQLREACTALARVLTTPAEAREGQ